MAVHPQVQAVLDAAAAAGARPYETMSVAEARDSARASIALSGALQEVAHVEHLAIPGPGGDLAVRVYAPAGKAPLPALVYYHGSGWVIHDLDTYDPVCRAMANGTGCVVVAVDYRKAPEHPFPAALDDCWATLRWTVDNAQRLGIDPRRIGIGGDSAGGNLAAVTAIRARDEGGPALACQLLIYPATDAACDTPSYTANAAGYLIGVDTMHWFWNHYLGDWPDPADPRVSPLRAPDLADLPPTLVVTAEYDPLRDDGRLFAERLRAAGVPVTHTDYAGMVHGFLRMHGVLDTTEELRQEIGAWVRSVMAAR